MPESRSTAQDGQGATITEKGQESMRFLIDTFPYRTRSTGELIPGTTVEIDLADCEELLVYRDNDVAYIGDSEPLQLSTARSLEAEAAREAEEIICQSLNLISYNETYEDRAKEWLEKWGAE